MMTDPTDSKKFPLCADPTCDSVGEHFHDDAWKAYWSSLSETEQQSLRNKAAWEHRSLSRLSRWSGEPSMTDRIRLAKRPATFRCPFCGHTVTYEDYPFIKAPYCGPHEIGSGQWEGHHRMERVEDVDG